MKTKQILNSFNRGVDVASPIWFDEKGYHKILRESILVLTGRGCNQPGGRKQKGGSSFHDDIFS